MMRMAIVKYEHNNWRGSKLSILVTFNESKGTMLQCPTAVALGMEVAHFLDLQGALVGNRLSISLSKNEAVFLAVQPFCNLATLLTVPQRHSTADWEPHQTFFQQCCLYTVFCNTIDLIFQLPKPQGNQCKNRHLSSKGLGGCNGILASRIAINTEFGCASNETSDGIDHTHHRKIILLCGVDDIGHILGLATLRHDQEGTLFRPLCIPWKII
mmetsp:Transcript_2994/g.5489  ORF Transcript_2994/g.5489 Transcript_2994/m.5489 type:complete len:213 (-) Transcript_2994:683-1321(-)